MAKISPVMLVPPVLFLGFALLMFKGLKLEDPDALPSVLEGKSAPQVEVLPLGDLPVFSGEALKGAGVKLVNFWASWCAPCRVEHPHLEALADAGLPIYGVNYKDKAPNALKFLADLGNPYTAVGADETGRMALNWGVYGVPETYVINSDGVIILRFAGPLTQRAIETTLQPAIDAAKAASAARD